MKTNPPFDGEIHVVSAKRMPDLNSPKREPGWFLGEPVPHHSEPAREAVALLPCPFCGGKADWHNIGNEHTKSRSTKIWCSECRVTRNTGAIRHSLEWTKEHAFAAWNTRASPAPAAGGLEAVIEGALSQAEMLLLAIVAGDPASELRIRVNDIIAALASPAATSAETQGGDGVRALPYLIHFVRQRWEGQWTYTVEQAIERWLSGEFHADAAESDAKAAAQADYEARIRASLATDAEG